MQTAAENRTGKWNTVSSIYRIWSNDGIPVTVLHTAGLEKKSFMTFSYSPLPPHPLPLCYYQQYYNKRVSNVPPSPDRREVMREAFPAFGQFLEHLHHWSFARCLCKSTSHGCKNDFIINSQRILNAIWSFVYYLERRKRGGGPEVQSSQTKC